MQRIRILFCFLADAHIQEEKASKNLYMGKKAGYSILIQDFIVPVAMKS